MRLICGILMTLTITALSLLSLYFAVYAFDLPRLGAAYALNPLATPLKTLDFHSGTSKIG